MNKRGQMFLPIVTAIMIFIVGMLVINLIKPEITTARDASNLDCGNTAISDGQMLTCLAVDATIPYYIIVMLAAAGGLITARFIGR